MPAASYAVDALDTTELPFAHPLVLTPRNHRVQIRCGVAVIRCACQLLFWFDVDKDLHYLRQRPENFVFDLV